MAVPVINPYTPGSPTPYVPTLATNPYYPNPYYVPPVQNQQQNANGMVASWVQGINGAKAYPLAPNSRAFLFDSEKDSFYVKTTDQSGMPQPIREFEYTEVVQEQPTEQTIDTSNFVTKEELEEALGKIKAERRNNNNGKSSIRGTTEQRNSGSIQ